MRNKFYLLCILVLVEIHRLFSAKDTNSNIQDMVWPFLRNLFLSIKIDCVPCLLFHIYANHTEFLKMLFGFYLCIISVKIHNFQALPSGITGKSITINVY